VTAMAPRGAAGPGAGVEPEYARQDQEYPHGGGRRWAVAPGNQPLHGYTRAVISPNAMEFSRLVKAVLHKDVAPAVNPDPRLVEDLATAMGHFTILNNIVTMIVLS